jgi:hypothetical protein
VNKYWLYGHKLTNKEVDNLKDEYKEGGDDEDEMEPGLVKEGEGSRNRKQNSKGKGSGDNGSDNNSNSNSNGGGDSLVRESYHERGWFPRACVQAKTTKHE